LANAHQAMEAAFAFGNFTSKLVDLPIHEIQITLPDFHNLSLRYHQFETSIIKGDKGRIESSKKKFST